MTKEAAKRFLEFVNTTGSPYHTVASVCAMLSERNFQRLHEGQLWNLSKGKKYYTIRDSTTILAFIVGKQFNPETNGYCIIGTHTDSPCLRTRPNNGMTSAGFSEVGIAPYGGGIWRTWFDRGLGIAGKVVTKNPDTGDMKEELIRISRPIAFIPNLAIHLTTAEERSAFKLDPEKHLHPVIATSQDEDAGSQSKGRFSAPLLKLIADELSCDVSHIADFDIHFMDATESRFCGANEEFVESPRLDNLGSTWTAFAAIADDSDILCDGNDIYISVAFDHEEVGSTSFTGANSNFMEATLKRISASLGCDRWYYQIIDRSLFISADMAHGIHPSYPEKHQAQHQISINKGVAIKTNSSQRYSTSLGTSSLITKIAEQNNVPVQHFVVRNDSACGSTIGPMIASNVGIRVIDLGIPQWAMHSIREICGAVDFHHLLTLFKAFFFDFRKADDNFVKL